MLLDNIKNDDNWHTNTMRLVAHLVGKGHDDEFILEYAPIVCIEGYSLEQTKQEIAGFIASARQKGFAPELAPQVTPEKADEASTNAADSLEWFADIEPVLTDNYLVKGVLGAEAMSVVYGPSNSGKTFFVLDLIWNVANATPWRGHRTKQASILYLAAEGGRGVQNRIAALKKETGLLEAPIALRRAGLDLLKSDADINHLAGLAQAVKVNHPDLPQIIVIDTLSRIMAGGDENSAQDMTALIKNLDAIRAHTGAHIILVHHSGKDTARGARGHSSLRAATDTEIEIETEDEETGTRTAKVTKQRDYQGGEKFGFGLKPVELGKDQDGDMVTSCVVEEMETTTRKKKPAGKHQKKIYELIQTMIAEGQGTVTKDENGFPQHPTGCVEVEKLRKRFVGKTVVGNPRAAWSEAFNQLENVGCVGINDGLVWII